MKYKVVSLFAGVGGIDLGFEQTKRFKTIWANEIDKNASVTYKENFGDLILHTEDIHLVDKKKIPKGDVVVSGFPCQAFSIAGYRKGFEDERGDLFFETLKVILAVEPEAILLENVKNLATHDNKKTFEIISKALDDNGYKIKHKILNAKDYGNIPQNRERIYIVGFKNKKALDTFEFPEEIPLTMKVSKLVDFEGKKDEKYYYRKGIQPFYDELDKEITNKGSFYQWRRKYVRENKNNVSPTLTANMGTGGHNVPLILTDNGIRKLTPKECFNIQGFPEKYKLPELANTQLYKQAGNSVVVPVIKRIAFEVANALDSINDEENKNASK